MWNVAPAQGFEPRISRVRSGLPKAGTLLLGNGSLFGVERIFYLYLGVCAIQTAEIGVLSHYRAQFDIEAKCEPLVCNFSYFKAFKIPVKAFEREKLLSALVWSWGVLIKKCFKPRVSQTRGRFNEFFLLYYDLLHYPLIKQWPPSHG